jgi:hypothetical protein
MMNNNNYITQSFKKSLFLLTIIICQSCFHMNPTNKEQVKTDVINYLHNKYHQNFDVLNSEWKCNTGNGCPDGHVVICFPIDNPEIKFRLDIVYDGKDFEVQRDEYKVRILNFQAGEELDKLVIPRIPLFEKNVSVLTDEKQVSQYDNFIINFEKVIEEHPNEITLDIELYILENNPERKSEYLSLIKTVTKRFLPLSINRFNLYFYFYNPNKYSKMARKEIKQIFETDYTMKKDPTNCEKKWAIVLEKKKTSNMDSVLNNLESYIHEYNYKK